VGKAFVAHHRIFTGRKENPDPLCVLCASARTKKTTQTGGPQGGARLSSPTTGSLLDAKRIRPSLRPLRLCENQKKKQMGVVTK